VDPTRGDAQDDEALVALVALEDLVGDAGEGPGDVTGVEDGASFERCGPFGGCRNRCGMSMSHQHRTSFSASQDGSLKDVDRW
jgi:hypothetical protein